MSDIVERLRQWEAAGSGGPLPKIPAVRNGEAADEIERLREENLRWQQVAKDVCARMDYECPPECDSYGHAENCGICDLCVTVDNLRGLLREASYELDQQLGWTPDHRLERTHALLRKIDAALADPDISRILATTGKSPARDE